MSMLKLEARGETFRVNQVTGNLFVCAEENGGCCCGHVEKGRAVVNKDRYAQLWEERKLRNAVHLTFVGCLGPCPIGNNAMVMMHSRAIWFKDLNDDRFIPMIFDYITAMRDAGKVLPPTGELASHVYERYLPVTDEQALSFGQVGQVGQVEQAEMDFDGIDPVCMMTVDPAKAEWKSEYAGKTYYFCAPSCKRSFDADPAAYVGGTLVVTQAAAILPTVESSDMPTDARTFVVPTITCDHCTRTIRKEVGRIAGVQSVDADPVTKIVTVTWQTPATWDQIKTRLTEIDYAPQDAHLSIRP